MALTDREMALTHREMALTHNNGNTLDVAFDTNSSGMSILSLSIDGVHGIALQRIAHQRNSSSRGGGRDSGQEGGRDSGHDGGSSGHDRGRDSRRGGGTARGAGGGARSGGGAMSSHAGTHLLQDMDELLLHTDAALPNRTPTSFFPKLFQLCFPASTSFFCSPIPWGSCLRFQITRMI